MVGLHRRLPLNVSGIFVIVRRSSSFVLAIALFSGVVLSACSSTERSAAPPEEIIASDQVTELVEGAESESDSEPDPESGQGAGPTEPSEFAEGQSVSKILGTDVCTTNLTNKDLTITRMDGSPMTLTEDRILVVPKRPKTYKL
jgi:hypothetical protein